jgi:hypothetical protein
VTYTRTFQLLACEISISTACREISDKLDYVSVRAEQHYPLSAHVGFRVDKDHDAYELFENERLVLRDGNADRILIDLFRRMHGVVYGEMAGSPRLHAGSGMYDGMLFLTVGPKGVGKSTLMTRLLFEGFTVFGDEMVLGLGSEVIALPRRFHIKAPALPLLPQIAAVAERLPFVIGDGGDRIMAFDPTDAGLPWAIRPGRPAAIFFLEPNHHGTTTVEPCARVAMIQSLMTQSALDGDDGRGWIRALGTLVRGAECYTLRIGDLSSAARVMREALQSAATREHQTTFH